MKKQFLLTITILFSLMCMSQNVKNKRIYIKQWHLPQIIVPNNLNSYSINFKDSNKYLTTNIPAQHSIKKQPLSLNIKTSQVREKLNLRTFKLVPENSDLKINFTGSSKDIFIKSSERKKNLSSKDINYKGEIFFTTNIKVDIIDNQGKTYYSFTEKVKLDLDEVTVLNHYGIKDKNKALSEAIKLFNKNNHEYGAKINSAYDSAVIVTAEKAKKAIDYYIEKDALNFFTIKKPEKYGVEKINQIADKMDDLSYKDYSSDYFKNLKSEAKTSIGILKNEIPKYDINNKSQKKILWVLYTNLSALNYLIENFDEAIEFAEKRKEIKYKRRYTYNSTMAKDRAKLSKKHFKENESIIRNFKTIDYLNENASTKDNQKEKESIIKIEEEGYVNGTLLTLKGETIVGNFKVEQNSSNSGIIDLSFPDATYVKMKYTNKKGKIRTKKFNAKDVESLILENTTFHSVNFKASSTAGGEVDLGKMLLSGSKNRFIRLLLNTPKVNVYQYNNEIVLKKKGDKKGQSTSTAGFALSFKKRLSKYFKDCSKVQEEILSGTIKNNKEDLLNTAEVFSKCN